jgi:CRISPR system Cascade subunit CasA
MLTAAWKFGAERRGKSIMNLVTEPWIPVVKPGGEHRLASLLEVFTEGQQFSDLSVRPHERIALMRLLICVAQAALDGPEDIDSWDEAPKNLPQAAERYLEKWRDSFDLFHSQKPFLQVACIEKPAKNAKADQDSDLGTLTSASKLDFALATGNNTTLFDHGGCPTATRTFPPAVLALMLLTSQQFSPGGLIAKVRWDGKETSKSSAHAPCTPSSMLHAYLRCKTLYDTICVNLLTKETVAQHFNHVSHGSWGKPIWECVPANLDDKPAVENATRTYLGRLVPLSRLLRLQANGDGILLGNGLVYPAFPEFPAEAAATIVISRNNEERQLLGAGAKAIWRDLSALIASRKQGQTGGALTLSNIPDNVPFDLWVGALLTNKASILDTVESVFHVPANMRTDNVRTAYDAEVRWAESIASKLSWAVETYREQIDGGWEAKIKMAGPKKNQLRGQLHATATRHYWTAVEKLRPSLMDHVVAIGTTADAVEQTRTVWRKAVHGAAREAYKLACGQETPRQMRAFALGWDKLFAQSKRETEPEEPETEEIEE